jgi:hypothetical protein
MTLGEREGMKENVPKTRVKVTTATPWNNVRRAEIEHEQVEVQDRETISASERGYRAKDSARERERAGGKRGKR